MTRPNPHKAVCAHCGVTTREGIEPVSHDVCRACLITQYPALAAEVLAQMEENAHAAA